MLYGADFRNNLFCNTKKHCPEAMLFDCKILVGMTGFEPATSSSRTMRATKLCYIPTRKYYTLTWEKLQVKFVFFMCKANLLHKFRKKCIVEII